MSGTIILQIIVSLLLVAAILIQSKGKGFGRSANVSFTRRGLERLIFKATFVLAALFIAFSILQIVI